MRRAATSRLLDAVLLEEARLSKQPLAPLPETTQRGRPRSVVDLVSRPGGWRCSDTLPPVWVPSSFGSRTATTALRVRAVPSATDLTPRGGSSHHTLRTYISATPSDSMRLGQPWPKGGVPKFGLLWPQQGALRRNVTVCEDEPLGWSPAILGVVRRFPSEPICDDWPDICRLLRPD